MAITEGTFVLTIRVASPFGRRTPDTAALERGRLRALQESIEEVATDIEDGNGDHGFEILELVSWEREE